MEENVVEKEILKELLKKLKWYEKIFMKIHIHFIDRIVSYTRVFVINKLVEK